MPQKVEACETAPFGWKSFCFKFRRCFVSIDVFVCKQACKTLTSMMGTLLTPTIEMATPLLHKRGRPTKEEAAFRRAHPEWFPPSRTSFSTSYGTPKTPPVTISNDLTTTPTISLSRKRGRPTKRETGKRMQLETEVQQEKLPPRLAKSRKSWASLVSKSFDTHLKLSASRLTKPKKSLTPLPSSSSTKFKPHANLFISQSEKSRKSRSSLSSLNFQPSSSFVTPRSAKPRKSEAMSSSLDFESRQDFCVSSLSTTPVKPHLSSQKSSFALNLPVLSESKAALALQPADDPDDMRLFEARLQRLANQFIYSEIDLPSFRPFNLKNACP